MDEYNLYRSKIEQDSDEEEHDCDCCRLFLTRRVRMTNILSGQTTVSTTTACEGGREGGLSLLPPSSRSKTKHVSLFSLSLFVKKVLHLV